MNKINLGETVMVSDPCYSEEIWCQKVVENVLPGEYIVKVRKVETDGWGTRCSALIAVHKDYQFKEIKWELEVEGNIGVDSGQCGIFSIDTFRKDGLDVINPKYTQYGDFFLPIENPGDDFYFKMCRLTLSNQKWGSYENGVVSSSGYGDGGYDLYLKKHEGKVVGFLINFQVEETLTQV